MPERGRGAALITGGARRIGRALTRACADAGFDVAIHVRTIDDDAEAAAADVRARGRRAHLLTCDLRQEAATVALVGEAESELGPVTLLVNNASVFEDDSLGSMNRASWDAHMETNLRAPLILAQALAPRIRVNGIGPGPTLQSIHQEPDDFAAEAASTLLRRSVD
ncbi:MAG: SDR family NAD(P)-dependent oxidoreductase, partial [Phenylobacterium sp.]|nr:SDR family NAD(P)-dependent oxidoreductase [Phenylobacterium sp.]